MNRTMVVTGATNGTGYAIARRFAKEGYNVCITSRDDTRAKEAAARLKEEFPAVETWGYGLEVCNESQMIKMFDELKASGHLVHDIVLCAANLNNAAPDLFNIDYDMWMDVVNTNLGWNFQFMRNAAKHMLELGEGSIVAIGSYGAERAFKGKTAYIASKGGLHALVRAFAVELGDKHIRVNTVVSGGIRTERYMANPALVNNPHNKCPMFWKNVADFDDIANAAYFLASDQAAFTTGAQLAVDGGHLAQLCYEEQACNPFTFK